jgi:hypothetical protein
MYSPDCMDKRGGDTNQKVGKENEKEKGGMNNDRQYSEKR